jgi:hypothetical protein
LPAQANVTVIRGEGVVRVQEVKAAEEPVVVAQLRVVLSAELPGQPPVAGRREPARRLDLRDVELQVLNEVALVLVLERVGVPEVLGGALEPEVRRERQARRQKKKEKTDRVKPLLFSHCAPASFFGSSGSTRTHGLIPPTVQRMCRSPHQLKM